MLAVSEIFGPTVQGEGPSTGRQATFLRLAGCNLTCSWCDTKYTWDWEHYDIKQESHLRSIEQVCKELWEHKTATLIITGGEPLLQQKQLADIALVSMFQRIEFETNGTIAPDENWLWQPDVYFNVSPKLQNAHNKPVGWAGVSALAKHERSIFKFVCQQNDDFDQIERACEEYEIAKEKVWIMPEGTSKEMLERHLMRLADGAVRRGYNITTRLHVQLWGNKRGR